MLAGKNNSCCTKPLPLTTAFKGRGLGGNGTVNRLKGFAEGFLRGFSTLAAQSLL
jgi:hypothetical protein